MPPTSLFPFLLVVLCAVLYFGAGRFEGRSGFGWGALSILTSVVVWRLLGGGLFAVLLGQVGLFIGITLYRSRAGKNDEPPDK